MLRGILRGATASGPDEAKYRAMGEKDVAKKIKRLEKDMLRAAKNLEFDKAAELRDQLKKLRESVFLSPL